MIYFYEPDGDVWTKATLAGGGDLYSYPMKTVTYCPNSWNGPKFLVAGGTGGSGYVYWAAGPGVDVQWSSSGLFNGFEVWDSAYNPSIGSNGALYLCANSATGLVMVEIILSSGGFNLKSSLLLANSYWRGIEVDPVSNDLYMVGNNAGGVLYYRFRYSDSSTFPLTFPYGTTISDIIFDSYHAPNRMIAILEYQDVGDVTSVYQITKGADSYDVVTPLGASPDYTYFYGIDIDSTGHAVLVGMNDEISNEGDVWDLWEDGSGNTHLIERSVSLSPFLSEQFNGVAIRPTGVQMALIAGSAFKYSYTSVLGPIQVDTAVPHIDYIDLYPTGSPSDDKLNSQIDVDIGDGGTMYTLEIGVYDSLGIARLTEVEVWMWYDQGNFSTDFPSLVTPAFDAPGWENTRMHFRITRAGPTITQIYPAQGPDDETRLGNGWWSDINATAATVTLDFSPHQQVRWAAGPFTESLPNMRYDPDFDGPETQEQSTINALNDDLTWDIKARVADDATTTNYATAYDEYGFYRYTYLGTSGIPNGGAVYGSGAPGTNNVVMSISGQNVTFSANCPYGLNIQLMGNLIGVAFAGTIPATDLSLQGGNIAVRTAFGVGGSTQQLIGPLRAPLDRGRVTTTSSWDGNSATWEPVRWWVNIPTVVEDSYVSQVTWAIVN